MSELPTQVFHSVINCRERFFYAKMSEQEMKRISGIAET